MTEEACADVSMNSGYATGVCYCPQDSCVHVFHRLSTLKRHLSLEKGTQSPYGLNQNVLQTLLGASVGVLLKALVTKKPLLFYVFKRVGMDSQSGKISQGGKLDTKMVVQEMHRANGS